MKILAIVLLLAAPVLAQTTQPSNVDIDKMNVPALRALAKRLLAELKQANERIKKLEGAAPAFGEWKPRISKGMTRAEVEGVLGTPRTEIIEDVQTTLVFNNTEFETANGETRRYAKHEVTVYLAAGKVIRFTQATEHGGLSTDTAPAKEGKP